MSTPPPNSRRPARGPPQSPSTPVSAQSNLQRTSSLSVEPRSEYLRNALQAQRAKLGTPTPSSAEAKTPNSTASSKSSDPWMEQAHSGEGMAQSAPMPSRRRRPSESALPRLPTQREIDSASSSMKDLLFDLNMRMQLLKDKNESLKNELEEALKRISDLEPLESEVDDLRDDNNQMQMKLQDLEDENNEMRDNNVEILEIQEQAVAEMGKQEDALKEAAEIIDVLDKERTDLGDENSKLKEQNTRLLAAMSNHGRPPDEVDGAARDRYIARVYSIDESRPSTSHFDSDYYSQPASPQVKVRRDSRDSLASLDYPERAKQFIEASKEGRKSVQQLQKRVSDISLKNAKPRTSSPIPEVPQIPEQYATPQTQKPFKRTPKKYRPNTPLAPSFRSNRRETDSVPLTPTSDREGLRKLYIEGKYQPDIESQSSRPWSSHPQTPLAYKHSQSTVHSDPEVATANTPSRHSNNSTRQAHTTSSSEQLPTPPPPPRVTPSPASQHDSKMSVHLEPKKHREHTPTPTLPPQGQPTTTCSSSEWAHVPPPPSVVSEDLTTEIIDRRDENRWWKSMDRLTNQEHGGGGRQSSMSGSRRDAGSRSTSGKQQPPSLASPIQEKNFLFNGAEDVDDFMRKAKGYMGMR